MNLQTDYCYLSNSLFLFWLRICICHSAEVAAEITGTALFSSLPISFLITGVNTATVRNSDWLTASVRDILLHRFMPRIFCYSTLSHSLCERQRTEQGRQRGCRKLKKIQEIFREFKASREHWDHQPDASFHHSTPTDNYALQDRCRYHPGFIKVTWRWRTCHFQWWIALIPAHLLC